MRFAICGAPVVILLCAQAAWAQAPASAPAAADGVRLTYRTGPGCPDEDLFRKWVTARIGWTPFAANGGRLAEVAIEQRGDSFVGRYVLRVGGVASSPRVRRDPRCRRLVLAVAVGLADAIRPPPEGPEAPATVKEEAEPEEPAVVAVPVVAVPVVPVARDRGAHLRLGMDAVGLPVMLPSAGVGVMPWLGLRLLDPSMSIEVGVRIAGTPVAAHWGATPYRSTYVAGVLAGCWHGSVLFACPMVEVGTIKFQAPPDLIYLDKFEPLVVAAGLRVGVKRALLPWLDFRSEVEVEGVAHGGRLHQTPRLHPLPGTWSTPRATLAFGLGLSVRLW